VSFPENPISEPVPLPPAIPRTPTPPGKGVQDENPPWTGWEVTALAVITFVSIVASVLGTAFFVHLRFAPTTPWVEALRRPEVIVGGQLLAYVLILLVMYLMVSAQSGGRVLEALRWNWPSHWTSYLLAGVALEFCLLPLAYLLPMPKNAPIDEFFRTARDAYILSLFGVLFAPLFEELFFRGFLYPVLARRVGLYPAVFLTALGFAAIHGSQLKYSWAVFIIFLVGVVLTLVRALRKSVAATVLMHMAYNATIFMVTYIATDRFRHMERFRQ
jgi:uncharacterized protein